MASSFLPCAAPRGNSRSLNSTTEPREWRAPPKKDRVFKGTDGTFPVAVNHFAVLNGLFPLAASKAR